jgi:hypothetical protein
MSDMSNLNPCGHLGLFDDHTVVRSAPTPSHRCYARRPPVAPGIDHQINYCLVGAHVGCPHYKGSSTASMSTGAAQSSRQRGKLRSGWGWVALALSAIIIVAFGVIVLSFGRDMLWPPADDSPIVQQLTPTAPIATATPQPTPTPSPLVSVAVQADNSTPTPPQLLRFITPTPLPGGQVWTISPESAGVGWWASNEGQRNHIGDSYLYSGDYQGQSYISAARFDLSRVARGAQIEQATLRLTGLRDDRFVADPLASWLVQIISGASFAEMTNADFLTAFSAPASITLPLVRADQLAAGETNTWELDAVVLDWLEQQLLDGEDAISVRVLPSPGNPDSLFAWDSGVGPQTADNPPQLILSVGPPPPTPPPLPTKPFLVATLTPVPQNVLTVVAQAATATTVADTVGTYTPVPYQVYTPTPFPENLATVQAVAIARGLLPVLLPTSAPANEATATADAGYATAVALTTGTFTPVPDSFVTPVLVLPSPPAENVATAAARVIAATVTAEAAAQSILPTPTLTPLPYNAVIAVYVYATATPGNVATAAAMAAQIDAEAQVNGTPTPLPWNAIIITSVPPTLAPITPSATPLPLIVSASNFTPTPTPAPTIVVPDVLPPELRNKIIFLSDRSGATESYFIDPANGQVSLITQSWVYPLARKLLTASPDGSRQAVVQGDANGVLQIQLYTPQYNTMRQITSLRGTSYDPTWSPTGNSIAFVSTDSGGDEIYTVDPEGQVVQRLTFNTWEWDKHPSWSPDGSQIVFFSNRDTGRRQIWVMNADGSNQRNLSNNDYNDWDPVWTR